MSRLPVPKAARPIIYPTSDGKPMAETDIHRRLMTELIAALQAFYADEPSVYISGNLLLFYEEGNNFTVSVTSVDRSDEVASVCAAASGRAGPPRCA
jgi:hypothetical protein